MAITNYYIGLKYGDTFNVNVLTVNTSTAGASVDVEVRIQVDTASTVQHKRLEALKCLEIIEAFIESAGNNHSGANLPIP